MSAKIDKRLDELGLPMHGRRVLVPEGALLVLLEHYDSSTERMVDELVKQTREAMREAAPTLAQLAELAKDSGRTADQIRADALTGGRRVESIRPRSDFL